MLYKMRLPSIERYKIDPCGTLSIPYYKAKVLTLPEGAAIVHEQEFDPAAFPGCSDEPYFRLVHRLSDIGPAESSLFSIRTAEDEDLPLVAGIIARSYPDIGISREKLCAMRSSEVFDPELWVIAYDKRSGLPAACGIAEYDRETGEAALDWIQTLPEFRRMGAGKRIVLELLSRLAGKAEFATVSGRVNDKNLPEALYRACGFEGNDIWHVLRKG